MRPKKSPPRTDRQTTRRLDKTLSQAKVPNRPAKGWLRSIREALGMTQKHLASRMGLSRQAIAAAEAAELDDSIKLSRLRAAAEALGCELDYVLIPKQPLEKMIADQARRRAEQKVGRVNLSQTLEASAVSSVSMVNDITREYEMNRPSDLWDD